MQFDVTQIGTVRTDISETAPPADFRDEKSRIEVDEAFADGLRLHDHVESVDVILPAATPIDRFELDVLLAPAADGLPPAVCGFCDRWSLRPRLLDPQGDNWQAILVV